ncbi:MAG: replication-associated recombination protein A [Mycoplasmataceae bacterium]|nr:replication-associated recombination protein A [Mycoplasmataceae bacterium]
MLDINIKELDDIVGQKHLVGKYGIIRKMIENKKIYSCIFFGLPGIGKTTLTKVICNSLKIEYFSFNPTFDSKKTLKEILENNFKNDKEVVLIIDEIHRMNRDKQDILLPYLETKKLIILGTTTENPYFSLNPAIRSRCQIFELKEIDSEDMLIFLKKVLVENKFKLKEDILKKIVINSLGDLRSSLNLLEIILELYKKNELNDEFLNNIFSNPNVFGSSYGNEFYNLQSAFHKSLRGSDVDAAIYYLARLIKIGDLQSISRRMIAMAYEDIGLANPTLLSRVILAVQSAERLGFPEANQILSSTVIEMCLSPKSNSAYLAINKALSDIDNKGTGSFDIPTHLKYAGYKSAKKLGYVGYKYPHDYENSWVDQEYLPKQMKDIKYYFANKNDIEIKMNKIWTDRKTKKN